MKKISVYHFCQMFHEGKEIHLAAFDYTNGTPKSEHRTFTDALDPALYEYKDYEVTQFKVTKKGTIDIIAFKHIERN